MPVGAFDDDVDGIDVADDVEEDAVGAAAWIELPLGCGAAHDAVLAAEGIVFLLFRAAI